MLVLCGAARAGDPARDDKSLGGEFTIYTVDGTQEKARGIWFNAEDKEPRIEFEGAPPAYAGGGRRSLPLSSFGYFENNLAKISKEGRYVVALRCGMSRDEDILTADSVKAGDGGTKLSGGVVGTVTYRENCVSRIIVTANYKDSHAAGLSPADEDVLVRANGDVSRGVLVSFDDDNVIFESGTLGKVTYKTAEVSLVMLVTVPAEANGKETARWKVMLSDKSRLVCLVRGISEGFIDLKDRFGHSLRLPLEHVISASYENPGYKYLSDLEPAEVIVKPHMIEGLPGLRREYRRDLSAKGTILSIKGRKFSKGLGVRASTTLRYKLGMSFNKFHATIGMDDCVDPRAGKLADARFYVYGDGKLLFKSGIKKYLDDPQDVRVDIKGVDVLELTVDFGETPEIGDWADWASARVTK